MIGIVVKIMNKKVGDGKFCKLKAVVRNVIDKYVGEVRAIDEGDGGSALGVTLRLDQEHLETVVPKVGKEVMIVNGRGRGCRATLLRINAEEFNSDLCVEEGPLAGMEVRSVEYEDFSRSYAPLVSAPRGRAKGDPGGRIPSQSG